MVYNLLLQFIDKKPDYLIQNTVELLRVYPVLLQILLLAGLAIVPTVVHIY